MFYYDSMNLLQRILRLPFVASSSVFQPFINTGLLALGLFGVVKKNPQLQALPSHQPVVKSNPLQIVKHFIDIYKHLRDSSADNEIIWLVKNTSLVVKSLFNMLFINESGNAVNELPHMLAGKIEAKHLIPNTGGRVYVLALSEGALASLGFVFFLFIRIFMYVMIIFILEKVCNYMYSNLFTNSRVLQSDKPVIDVSSKDLEMNSFRNDKKDPVYLKNYIKNRNV